MGGLPYWEIARKAYSKALVSTLWHIGLKEVTNDEISQNPVLRDDYKHGVSFGV